MTQACKIRLEQEEEELGHAESELKQVQEAITKARAARDANARKLAEGAVRICYA